MLSDWWIWVVLKFMQCALQGKSLKMCKQYKDPKAFQILMLVFLDVRTGCCIVGHHQWDNWLMNEDSLSLWEEEKRQVWLQDIEKVVCIQVGCSLK
jgi:hypothetical protein